jgi:hypothetical protein
MDRDERPAGDGERGWVGRACSPDSLPQFHDGEDAEDADGDEDALNETSRDIPHREAFVDPPEDRKQHDGGADVRDDKQDLQEHAEEDPLVGARAEDVVVVLQERAVQQNCGDRRDERDDEQHACKARGQLPGKEASKADHRAPGCGSGSALMVEAVDGCAVGLGSGP